ncbi:MAG: orotidine-5'-phosphate decarboxylase, partial [Anaerolineales bacterium]
MTPFFDLLEARARETGSLLCVGLDPPESLGGAGEARAACFGWIDATAPSACAFKVNSAFFEIYGAEGWEALRRVIQHVPPEIPVILDAKRGDIASTARAYARAGFESLGAGAMTVSPYLGSDSWLPFLENPEKAIFLLCKTSNPGADEFQTLPLASGEPLYLHLARECLSKASGGAVGLVVGATDPDALAQVRTALPKVWILAPGVGAQGGDLERAVAAGLREDGLGILVPISRALASASDPRAEAQRLAEAIHSAGTAAQASPRRDGLAAELVQTGCVALGEFRLRTGETSPIYLDLRRLASHPRTLARAAAAYVPILNSLEFDRLAGLPYAGLPIATAVALRTGVPMIYPRREVKDYGTRASVEGEYHPGERVVL